MFINSDPEIPEGYDKSIYGANQKEYLPLPCAVSRCKKRQVLSEWIPTAEELSIILNGGKIRVRQQTFHKPLQPIYVEVIE